MDAQTDYDKMKGRILDEMKRTFNPEMINRIDETVIFHALDRSHILKIIDILLKDLVKRMASKQITIELREDAKEFLADKGFDPTFGARPLKRALQRHLEDPLAEEILRGEYTSNSHVTVYKHETEDRLAFKISRKKADTVEEAEEFKAPK
jgi:ATP-dependent Clp protease ATP-binding subunit ClpC